MATFRLYSWGNVGDAILLTPVLRSLRRRYPSVRIILYVEKPSHREVYMHNPRIDRIRRLGVLAAFVHGLIPGRVFRAPLGDVRPNVLYETHASRIMGEMIGLEIKDTAPELFLTDDERALGRRLVQNLPRPSIAVHPISTFEPKNWPHDRWEQLVAQRPEWSFVQIGGAGETPIRGAADMRGKSLRVTFSIIGACDALVGVDSGMVHAAAALRKPSVVLFGPSSPMVYGHVGLVHLRAKVDCEPCLGILRDDLCPFNNKCINAISIAAVDERLSEVVTRHGTE